MAKSGKRQSRTGKRAAEAPVAAGGATAAAARAPVAARRRSTVRTRRRWLLAAGVAIVAVGLAAAAFLHWREPAPASAAGVYPAASGTYAATTATSKLPGAHYVGGKACAECHVPESKGWQGSDHDLAMQVADPHSVLGNFNNAKFTYAGTTSTFSQRDGKYFVNTDGPDGKRADYEIKYTFGVRPLQQYLVEWPGGRKQALGIAWDARPKTAGGQRWFHLYPGQNIKAGDPLHWTGINQNWNFQCAECHSTNLRKGYDAQADTFNTTYSELNVSCEACHGPGSNHVDWAGKRGDWQAMGATKGLAIALDERKGVTWTPVAESGNAVRSKPRTTALEIDTCARCHARTSRISDDYVHGAPLLDSHRPVLLDEGLYWNDGQQRDEVYNWGSFLQSRMNAHGVTCSDCHDPHTLKLRADGNAVCEQCHQPAKYAATTHTHHSEGTGATACVACHMPTTTYMVVDARPDHSLRIPRPDISAKIGSPNACNNCHTKETPQWAAAAIHQWTGKDPASFQAFGEALHAGTLGAPGAREALVKIINDPAQPAIVRASAINRLGNLVSPSTGPVLATALGEGDANVRLAAVEALAQAPVALRQRYLSPLLSDPVLAVRIEAAHALVGEPAQGLPEAQQQALAKAIAEYIAVQTYNADRPEGRMSLGNLDAQRGDAEGAIREYRKAMELEPTFVASYINLADLYRARGNDSLATRTLREGIARNPREAALHYALGLALVREKQSAEALAELQAATRLAPRNARYAYVYGVALSDGGRAADAANVLRAALKQSPFDRDILAALADVATQAGQRDQALAYAVRLRELDPENPQYAQMEQQLRQGR